MLLGLDFPFLHFLEARDVDSGGVHSQLVSYLVADELTEWLEEGIGGSSATCMTFGFDFPGKETRKRVGVRVPFRSIFHCRVQIIVQFGSVGRNVRRNNWMGSCHGGEVGYAIKPEVVVGSKSGGSRRVEGRN